MVFLPFFCYPPKPSLTFYKDTCNVLFTALSTFYHTFHQSVPHIASNTLVQKHTLAYSLNLLMTQSHNKIVSK